MLIKQKGYFRFRLKLPWGTFWIEWQTINKSPGIIAPAAKEDFGGWK